MASVETGHIGEGSVRRGLARVLRILASPRRQSSPSHSHLLLSSRSPLPNYISPSENSSSHPLNLLHNVQERSAAVQPLRCGRSGHRPRRLGECIPILAILHRHPDLFHLEFELDWSSDPFPTLCLPIEDSMVDPCPCNLVADKFFIPRFARLSPAPSPAPPSRSVPTPPRPRPSPPRSPPSWSSASVVFGRRLVSLRPVVFCRSGTSIPLGSQEKNSIPGYNLAKRTRNKHIRLYNELETN
jgi:hypothetical protein